MSARHARASYRPRRTHKYDAKPTEVDGFKFPSLREARHYQALKTLRSSGKVDFFVRQVPFHLPGGVKLVLDFMVFWADGTVTFEDAKGHATESYRAKKRMVEALYPVEITEV